MVANARDDGAGEHRNAAAPIYTIWPSTTSFPPMQGPVAQTKFPANFVGLVKHKSTEAAINPGNAKDSLVVTARSTPMF